MILNITLDIKKLVVNTDGIEGFKWCYSRNEILTMRDELTVELIKLCKYYQNHDPEEIELFHIFILIYISKVMSIYQTGLNFQRFTAQGVSIKCSDKSLMFSYFLQNTLPQANDFSTMILKGIPRANQSYSFFARPLWRINKMLEWNGYNPFRWINSNAIHCIEYSKLVKQHAKYVSEKIVYSSFSDWFPLIERKDAEQSPSWKPLAHNIRDHIVEVTGKISKNNGLFLDERWVKFLQSYLDESTASTRIRLHTLQRQSHKLPKHLWTGTGGNIWSRILRHAVRKNGGIVTGHDHSNGIGHLKYHVKLLNDYESCDYFITFTQNQAANLTANCRRDWLIPDHPPHISFVPKRNPDKLVPVASSINSKTTIKNLMYISSFYNVDRFHFGIQIPDYIQVDWEARLFSHLHQWDYQVYHKPHPGSIEMPPEEIYSQFNVKRLHEPFEKVMPLSDAVVFTNPQSTTIVHALKSGIPMVFIDLGMFEWMPDAYEMIQKRCAIVTGYFDQDHRAQVDWDELKNAIPLSIHKNDNAFVQHYL